MPNLPPSVDHYSVRQVNSSIKFKYDYEMRCLHVDEAGHDDGVPVVQERPAEHEAPVVPDGDGVDEPSFDLHCRHQSINHATTIGIRELQATTLNRML